MNKSDLKNLTKTQLINLILKQNNEIKVLQQQNAKPIPKPRTTKPVPLPRKSVKQMVRDYEDNIVPPTPKPRIISKKPVPAPRTKIERVANALKGYTKSFEISIDRKSTRLNSSHQAKPRMPSSA